MQHAKSLARARSERLQRFCATTRPRLAPFNPGFGCATGEELAWVTGRSAPPLHRLDAATCCAVRRAPWHDAGALGNGSSPQPFGHLRSRRRPVQSRSPRNQYRAPVRITLDDPDDRGETAS